MPGIQGDNNVLVPMIDSVIVLEGRFDLNSAEEGMSVFRAVVDVAYQVRFFRSHVANEWNEGSVSICEGWEGGPKVGRKFKKRAIGVECDSGADELSAGGSDKGGNGEFGDSQGYLMLPDWIVGRSDIRAKNAIGF